MPASDVSVLENDLAQPAAQLKNESHFEVHVLTRGRWIIECTSREQGLALEDANELVRRPDIRGVKVIKETYSPFNDLTAAISIFNHIKPEPKRGLVARASGPVLVPKPANQKPGPKKVERRIDPGRRATAADSKSSGLRAFGVVSIVLTLCAAGVYLIGIIAG